MPEAPKPPPPPRRPPPPPSSGASAYAPTLDGTSSAAPGLGQHRAVENSNGLDVESATPPPSKVDPYVGKTVDGRYVVERILGEGGMGVDYLARHKVIDKRVAIKVLRGEMATDH